MSRLEIYQQKLEEILTRKQEALDAVRAAREALEERLQELRRFDMEIEVAKSWIAEESGGSNQDQALPFDGRDEQAVLPIRHPTVNEQVTEFFQHAPEEFSAGDVIKAVISKYPSTRPGTIYNVLASCVSSRAIERVRSGIYRVPKGQR